MTPASPRVALLIENGFEDGDVIGLLELLGAAQVEVTLIAPFASRQYTGQHGHVVTSAAAGSRVPVAELAAIVIPGGQAPDRLRMRHALVDLVRDAVTAGVPVAAIGHGPQVLISADVVRGRTLTCWPSIAIDVKNAGGLYVDRPVAEDGPLLTSRKTDDVKLLAAALIARLRK